MGIDIETANRWNDREVLEQWHKLFKGDELTRKFAQGELVEANDVNRLRHSIAIYRSRLCDISYQCFQKSALLKRTDSKTSKKSRR
ncbi:hypothetical protein LFREDSHE_22210 [Shewanella baltica]